MATPFYLQAPQGEEAPKPSFLDRVGTGLGNLWTNAPPEAFFSLAEAMARPGGPFGSKLAMGLSGFGRQMGESQKRKGLASAFDSMAADIPEQMRPIFEAARNDPEMQRGLLSGMVSKMVGTDKGDSTSDIKNYEYAVNQGFKGTYFDFKNQLAMAGAGVAPVNVPGVGAVNPKTGEIVPGSAPPPAATPQLRPTAPDPSLPPRPSSNAPRPAPGQEFIPEDHPELGDGMMPPPAPAAAAPTGRKPILEAQAKVLNLSSPGQGQRWVYGDNNQPMLEDVPGFKAAPTALPAEIGARIGLAEGFLKRYDGIYKKLPELETVLGRGQVLFNTGIGAEVKRHIETGAEALVRSLTGAGKSKEEAESYASRYLPSPLDTAFDLKSKLEGLRYDLENSIQGTMKDKGGWKSPAKDPIKGIPLPSSPLQLKNDNKTIYQTSKGPAYYIGNGKFKSAE